ncbi:hypothetical protein AAMO2058_001407300 [Amorphochlora amoebiformis]
MAIRLRRHPLFLAISLSIFWRFREYFGAKEFREHFGAKNLRSRQRALSWREAVRVRGGEYIEDSQSLLKGAPLNKDYQMWEDKAWDFTSDDSDAPRRPPFVDTILSEESVSLIVNFTGNDTVVACYSGMAYAIVLAIVVWLMQKNKYSGMAYAEKQIEWYGICGKTNTGRMKDDMAREQRRIAMSHVTEIEPFLDVDVQDAVHYIKKQFPNCTGVTLLCFMPPVAKSQFGRLIDRFKRNGGRKIVVSGSLLGDADMCGDDRGWKELHTNWDKAYNTIASELTPLTLTLWQLPEDVEYPEENTKRVQGDSRKDHKEVSEMTTENLDLHLLAVDE